jgi:hypothetical protein
MRILLAAFAVVTAFVVIWVEGCYISCWEAIS